MGWKSRLPMWSPLLEREGCYCPSGIKVPVSHLTFFFFNLLISFIYYYFWLHWVLAAAHGPSLAEASGGHSPLCVGFSLWWPLLPRSTGSRRAGFSSCGTWASVVVAHRLSCSTARGILLDQGSNPCPLHWQADS